METNILLLIASDADRMESLRDSLGGCGHPLLGTVNVSLALARIGGGGVGAIVLHLSGPLEPNSTSWNPLHRLREQAPSVNVIVVATPSDPLVRARALEYGASGYVSHEYGPESLRTAVKDALAQRYTTPVDLSSRSASVISLIGPKGGLGTTTTALNLATQLTMKGSVILTEFRPSAGSLLHYFRTNRATPTLADLLQPGSIRSVESTLWHTSAIPELSVLFAPHELHDYGPVSAARSAEIIEDLARLADFVVVDLPPSINPANKSVLSKSDYLGFITDREPVCLASAKQMLAAIEEQMPPISGAVVVNRAPLVAPLPLSDVEAALGLQILEVIPPAADFCLVSQKVRQPLVQLDPESLVSLSFASLSRHFPKRIPSGRRSPSMVTASRNR